MHAGKNLSGHFSSHSQPTLEAVWRKPAGAKLHAPPKASPEPAPAPPPPAAPAGPAGFGSYQLEVPAVQPGEVRQIAWKALGTSLRVEMTIVTHPAGWSQNKQRHISYTHCPHRCSARRRTAAAQRARMRRPGRPALALRSQHRH